MIGFRIAMLKHFVTTVLCILAAAAVLMGSVTAYACRQPSLESRVDGAHAVFHLRVVEARLVQLEDLGIACDAQSDMDRCGRVEVRFDILEAYKDPAEMIEVFYAGLPGRCHQPIGIGEEYVFLLEDHKGFIESYVGSLRIGRSIGKEELTKLRDRIVQHLED
ncbi:hypothetical protein HBA54_05440 [Pelagibius litoralis]|uniref:Uncharacterized protein n=1 Tax=Pelagibius litoralis TaxID=374515 RepID=A0A967EVM2_9PROT|nr:hypothetical protein [Pelagibius litoralis]NIA68029.1 hypothetical protein [Pelagibius litoralis]